MTNCKYPTANRWCLALSVGVTVLFAASAQQLAAADTNN